MDKFEFLYAQNELLRDAAIALYTAGYWYCDELNKEDQILLWEKLRDAAGMAPGTATKCGVGKK
jgi:hypothetical protein